MTENMEHSQKTQSNRGSINLGGEEIEVDIRDLLLMLWRRKMVILSALLIGLSLATILITFMKPLYSARSLLLVENSPEQKLSQELGAFLGSARFDTSVLLSELEILKSRSMGRMVVERLGLMTDPEFNPRLNFKIKQADFSSKGVADVERQKPDFLEDLPLPKVRTDTLFPKHSGKNEAPQFKDLSLYKSELDSLPPEVTNRVMADVTTTFLNNLVVRSIPGSFAIQVEFTSVDPYKAALITNTIADIYIEQRLERKFAATKKVTDWLDRRLTDLREQVRNAEAAVQNYKAQNNIVQGTRSVSSVEQLSALNAQLVQAKAKKAEAEARLSEITKIVDSDEKIETAADIVNSDLVRKLKFEIFDVEGRLSEASTRYGEKHPVILEITSELNDLRRTLRVEMKKVIKQIENEVVFSKASVDALQEGLNEVSGDLFDDSEAMIQLGELEREAESSRLILDKFLATHKRQDNQEQLQEAEARVISYAVVPREPSFPNKMLLLSLSAALSLFLGLALALLIEKLDNTFKSAGQLEAAGGYPCYAMIPELEKMPQKDLVKYILSKPSSTVAESVRTLRMVLNLRSRDEKEKVKVVTVTSSFPGEGKTTLSIWMARLAAKSGDKVIVIDCDLRRPNIHRSLGRGNDATLVEYLTGKKELDEVIQKDEQTGAHMIFARSVPNSALDLITSAKMKTLIKSLREVYDLVIIDSPACLAVSDARVLATYSDVTLYGVAWDRTPREVVTSGVKQFSDMGYNNLAFVLTNVDVRRHVRYGYGDTMYYYGRYKEYYAN